jgi:hypothetical protein
VSKEACHRWYVKNRLKKLAWARQYRLEHLEMMRERDRAFRKAHPDRARSDARKYRATVNGKLRDNLNRKMNYAIHGVKAGDVVGLTGCTIEFLRGYLESKFKPGMTWDNYGKFGWHVDHIKACAKFDLSDSEQQRACFHYTNLQPMWAKENHSKGAR